MRPQKFSFLAFTFSGLCFSLSALASPLQIDLFAGTYQRVNSQCSPGRAKMIQITPNESNSRWLDWKEVSDNGDRHQVAPWLAGPPKEGKVWLSGGGCWSVSPETVTTTTTGRNWLIFATDYWEDCRGWMGTGKPKYLGRVTYKVTVTDSGLVEESIGTQRFAKKRTHKCSYRRLQ